MATQPETLAGETRRLSPDGRRIGQLAQQSAFSNAQRWFVRERAWINEQQLQLCRIPAPTFFEHQRAEWFGRQLESTPIRMDTDFYWWAIFRRFTQWRNERVR